MRKYIECSSQNYRIAYELLSDGVLDYTLDDLPAPARKLLELFQMLLWLQSQNLVEHCLNG